MPEQDSADHEEDGKDCYDRDGEAYFVGHEVDENCVAVFHGQDSFDEVTEGTSAQEREHESPERYLEDAFSQYENFERKWRREDAGDENAEEGVALDPALHAVGATMFVKINFAAFFRE